MRVAGIKGFTIRFDDQPAEKMQLSTDIEKQIGAAAVSGDAFLKLQGSKRLRMEALTYRGNTERGH